MEHIDLLPDICFLLLGIACAVFIIIRRKRFDLFAGLLTCCAWILKGVKRITYHFVLFRLEQILGTGNESVTDFNIRASLLLQAIDYLVICLLLVVVMRFLVIWQFRRWYKKAEKELRR